MNNASFSLPLCSLKAPPGVHHSMAFPRLRNAAQKHTHPHVLVCLEVERLKLGIKLWSNLCLSLRDITDVRRC